MGILWERSQHFELQHLNIKLRLRLATKTGPSLPTLNYSLLKAQYLYSSQPVVYVVLVVCSNSRLCIVMYCNVSQKMRF